MNWIKQNWIKIIIGLLACTSLFFYIKWQSLVNNLPPSEVVASPCEDGYHPIDRCVLSTAAINGYTFEMIEKYGSYGAGPQPDSIFETNLRIVFEDKTVFDLIGQTGFLANEQKDDSGNRLSIETASDFKKLSFYYSKNSDNPVLVFLSWPGGYVYDNYLVYLLELGAEGKFKVLPQSMLSELEIK